jgi:hypothetical protein
VTDDLEPVEEPRRRPIGRTVLGVVVAVALGGVLAWWLQPRPAPAPSRPAATAAPASEARSEPVAPAPAPRASKPGHVPAPSPSEPEAGVTPPPSAPTLKVASDVDGAFVFVDRQFVGKTPLETTAVTPGHHQLKISAEGYDGIEQGIDVAAAGETSLSVSLKTVRLNASVDVVHKHGIGSCDGRLVATVDGLRYETSNAGDAFAIPFDRLETFSLDYLGKTLKVKERNGRTWNFTTKAPNADPLLVFSRQVEKARAQLAARP